MTDTAIHTDTVALYLDDRYAGGFEVLQLRSYEHQQADVSGWSLADMLVQGHAVVGKSYYTTKQMSFEEWQAHMKLGDDKTRWQGWRVNNPAIHTFYRYQTNDAYVWIKAEPSYSGERGTLNVHEYILHKKDAIGLVRPDVKDSNGHGA